MKQMILVTIFSMLLSLNSCKRNNHYVIHIKNNSIDNILLGRKFTNSDGNCIMNGLNIESGESFEFRPFKSSIEKSLSNSSTIELYIIDPTLYNSPNHFYPCDSIEIKNNVLKHYILTKDDLKQSDFTIIYQ